jgi:peroxiredoxin
MRKIALSVATLALIAAPAFAGKYNKKISVGDKAPAFSGIPAVMKGEECSVSLSDIKEDVVVLAVLANHCPAVVRTQDRMIDLAKSFEGKSVRFIGIGVSSKSDRDTDCLAAIKKMDKGYPFAYGYDDTQQFGKDYGATNTPQFYVLDKARTIRYTGALDDSMDEAKVKKSYVKDAVESLLVGKEIEVKETRAYGCGISYDRK